MALSTSAEAPTRVLITGALGQIGTELAPALRALFGAENVHCSDMRASNNRVFDEGPFHHLDVRDRLGMERLVVENKITWLIHNASLLSATGEQNPMLALDVNVGGLQNALNAARDHKLRVLVPSSIAAFGPETPLALVPDVTVQRPNTVYGITKVWVELLGGYYRHKWGVDFRSLRYPGIVSTEALPGGGTTDWIIDIFYQALQKGEYKCFLRGDSALPMMFMSDCVRSTIELMQAPRSALTQHTYNVTAMSLAPNDVAEEIARVLPGFSVTSEPDFRQAIADSWPRQLDDTLARRDWGWRPEVANVSTLVDRMMTRLKDKLAQQQQQ